MLKSHVHFQPANGKRLVLVVDDEAVNRELLGFILESEYEVIFAVDGEDGLKKLREYQGRLSLVLLDLLMPRIHGLELLGMMKADEELSAIPVIVLTSEKAAEVDSLRLGASDFIPKPYDLPEVILARVRRTIELNEDRYIIESTERDSVTGLYNREYFYRYAEQYDRYHPGEHMDALVIDVNHFRMINERFGKEYGDEVLRRVGQKVGEMVSDTGGIACRSEADTFLAYCPGGRDYQDVMDSVSADMMKAVRGNISTVRLRMGVYRDADKTMDIERRFDRAKQAADTIRNNFLQNIAFFNSALHEKEIFAERLVEGLEEALAGHQFRLYLQPKFNIRGESPVLSSAEALVRWEHPELGMISPGVFVPLLEGNGLVQRLDEYVWREAAAWVRRWKDKYGTAVPVSINVSRIDMYDPNLVNKLLDITLDAGISAEEYLLEITESAYAEDADQIIGTVKELRKLGFRVEMDDFGSGYSSLNMLSRMPIDALKLDMKFMEKQGEGLNDERLLKLMIDIAEYLSVPVIAEGVETKEQVAMLKRLGCDIVQGYYFSRPLPAEEFERFTRDRAEAEQKGVYGADG